MPPAASEAWNRLTPDIETIERESGGELAFAARDLSTGAKLLYKPDRPCKTASVIKLPMLVHIALLVSEGAVSWSDMLTLTEEEKVGGSGVLTSLTPGTTWNLRDLCVLMTILSDNTATNMLIERFGVAPFNDRMRALGYGTTTLFRKSYSPDTETSRAYGFGVTTPREMCDLAARIANDEIGSAAVCAELRDILSRQHYRDALPRLLSDGWKYAGKTGAIDPVRNDVGILTAPDGRSFAVAAFCQELPRVLWTADNPGLLAIARLSRLLVTGEK